LSPGRKQGLSNLLTDIALRTFDKQAHREYWIALIGAESGYDGDAKSPAGAIGLGQLLPQYRADFAASCGMGETTSNDMRDDSTNATISACWFSFLIKATGSVPMALAAYNAGLSSAGIKALKRGAAASAETNGYVTRIWISKEGS